MVKARVCFPANKWTDEHILVIGTLPFAPQKDGTTGPSSWKPVKDLVRFCMAQCSGDDPKVEIRDYYCEKFQPQAFVKLRREENARCVFERIAGNFWYGTILKVWWMISPTQVSADRPARLIHYSDRREHPEALEKHTQIRDAKLLSPGIFSQVHILAASLRNTRSHDNALAEANGNARLIEGRLTNPYGVQQSQTWPAPPSNAFPYCCSTVNNLLFSEPCLSATTQSGRATLQQWPMAIPTGPQLMTGQDSVILGQVPIQQWVTLGPGLPPPVPAYEVPISMNMPIPVSLPIGMTHVYPTTPTYMVSPMIFQDNYVSGGYESYVPPPNTEYSYPNQKPQTSGDCVGVAAAGKDVNNGSKAHNEKVEKTGIQAGAVRLVEQGEGKNMQDSDGLKPATTLPLT